MNYQPYRQQQTCIKCGWPTYDGMVHHCPSAPMRDSVTFVTNDSARIDAAEAANASLTDANSRLVAQRSVDQATLTSLAQKRADLGRQSARTHASLHAAAASAPDWASTPVPKEVQDALRP